MTSIPNVNAEILKRAQVQIQQDLQAALDAFSLPEPLKICSASYGDVRWKTS